MSRLTKRSLAIDNASDRTPVFFTLYLAFVRVFLLLRQVRVPPGLLWIPLILPQWRRRGCHRRGEYSSLVGGKVARSRLRLGRRRTDTYTGTVGDICVQQGGAHCMIWTPRVAFVLLICRSRLTDSAQHPVVLTRYYAISTHTEQWRSFCRHTEDTQF